MTGFGHADRVVQDVTLHVEVRSVNHRFLQVRVRGPKDCPGIEAQVERLVRDRVRRGRVEVTIAIDSAGIATSAGIDVLRAEQVAAELRGLRNRLDLDGGVTLEVVLNFPGVVVERDVWRERDLEAAVQGAVEEALEGLERSREREGAALVHGLRKQLQALREGLTAVVRLAPERSRELEARLRRRVVDLLGEHGIDEARIVQEVAIQSERTDITEECDRLRAHLEEVQSVLEGGGTIGRRLDFLAQELHRECSTIGAKANSAPISRWVVRMKEEVERFREQVQNLE